MSVNPYVGNLSFATTELDLQELFAQVGTVLDVKIIQDKLTGSRGFGFVTMSRRKKRMAPSADSMDSLKSPVDRQ